MQRSMLSSANCQESSNTLYFEKLKNLEAGDAKRTAISLDKAAVGRVIKQALVNDQCSLVSFVLIIEQRRETTSMISIERSKGTGIRISLVENQTHTKKRKGHGAIDRDPSATTAPICSNSDSE